MPTATITAMVIIMATDIATATIMPMAITITITDMSTDTTPIIMTGSGANLASEGLLRLLSWLSPAFPTGAYSYSHGLEQTVERGYIHDLVSLVEWLDADLRFGSARNEGIFFKTAWIAARDRDHDRLFEVAKTAAAYRGTAELSLESTQQGAASLAILRRVWPDPVLDDLARALVARDVAPTLAVVLGARTAGQDIPLPLAMSAFLQSYVSNLISAAVRLISIGQTSGQLALAELEPVVIEVGRQLLDASLEDLGSAAFMIDVVSMAHETQYTRLFRS